MARALKQAGSTPKEGGQYVNVLFCFVCFLFVPGLREEPLLHGCVVQASGAWEGVPGDDGHPSGR